jgi:hypothetical protein
MARRVRLFLFITILSIVGVDFRLAGQAALAAGLDKKGEADAKEATRLFKQGLYEKAAPIYAKLSVDYPDMVVFERNLGACYYHLRKPEPAVSNLQRYLGHKKNIEAQDKATVDRWIDEMEKLRAQDEVEKLRAQNEADAVKLKPQPSLTQAEQPPETKTAESLGPDLARKPNDTENKPSGLDLSDKSRESDTTETGSPFYKKWWFWTGVGAVVAAGVVTAVALSSGKGSSNVPASALGNQGAFQ